MIKYVYYSLSHFRVFVFAMHDLYESTRPATCRSGATLEHMNECWLLHGEITVYRSLMYKNNLATLKAANL